MPNRRYNLLLLAGVVLGACLATGQLAAQTTIVPEETRLPEDTRYPGEPPASEYTTYGRGEGGEPEFPYRRVLTERAGTANQGYYSTSFGGRLEPKLGGARLTIPTDLLQTSLRYNAPLRVGSTPTNAEVKIGRFYLDVLSLSSSLLYSDNIDRTFDNVKDGFINVVDLDLLGILQFTDRLRLAFRVGLIYFPLDNTFGVAGFTRDRFGGRIFYGNSPYMLTQFTYDLELADWHLHFFDSLRSVQNIQANSFQFLGGLQFDEEDRAGRYAFRSTFGPSTNGVVVNETQDREAFIEVVNTVGASLDRLLPTVTRFEAGAFHSDSFYYGTDNGSRLPHSREVAYASLSSERETMRFQPFASYRLFHADDNAWSREARGGLSGPVTENIHFIGSAGYLWEGHTEQERMIVNARLRHVIGPNTLEQFRYRRDLTYPELDLENSYTYAIRQVLGPYLYGEAFVKYGTFEDLDKNDTGTEEWRTGLHFTLNPSSKTTFRVGGLYSQANYVSNPVGKIERWTAVGQIRREFGKSLEAMFTYQFQRRRSDLESFSYDENLFVLTLTYYFGERHLPPSYSGEQPYEEQIIRNRGVR